MMDIKKLRKHSKKTREVADKLLRDTQVKGILSRYGDFFIGGSYALNLMYGPDIDIVVECINPRNTSLAALKEFIDKRRFQKYEYGDFVKYPREHRPKGFIVNLIQDLEGQKWEIEVWFLKTGIKKEKDYIKKIASKLTSEKKDIILTIKYQRANKELSKHQLSSAQIYEKVLTGEMKDISDIVR